MNLDMIFNGAQSAFTAISFATFVGIILWAYSARRKDAFAEAANLPFADDEADMNTMAMEARNG